MNTGLPSSLWENCLFSTIIPKRSPKMNKQTHWLGYVAGILSLIFAAMFLHG